MNRWLPIVAAAFLLAGCDNSNDKPPATPQASSQASSGGSATDEKLVTGPRGAAEALPKVNVPSTPADSGRDSAATKPKAELTKPQEQNAMPKAGQANNHSSEALSKPGSGAESSTAQASAAQGASSPAGSSPSAPTSDSTQLAQAGSSNAGNASSSGGSAPAAGAAATAAAGAAGAATAAGGSAKPVSQEQALALMKKHNCASCHAVDKKLVGPGYKEVAAKYKGDPSAEAKLIDKVVKGGSGVWGPVPMPPHPTVPKEDIQAIVDWCQAGAS